MRLTSVGEFPPSQRKAVTVVSAELAAGGEQPSEFFADVERENGLLVFHLWHESAFLPENQLVLGNPGGLCRDYHVDPSSPEVVAKLWWQ